MDMISLILPDHTPKDSALKLFKEPITSRLQRPNLSFDDCKRIGRILAARIEDSSLLTKLPNLQNEHLSIGATDDRRPIGSVNRTKIDQRIRKNS